VVLGSERRMTAREDESELVVPHGSVLSPLLNPRVVRCGRDRTELFMELPASGGTATIIDRTVSCGRHDPSRRVGWDTVAPPPVACRNERFLDGDFGKRDVAEDADQRCHRLAVHLTEHTLNTGRFPMGDDCGGHAWTRPVARNGRTSIGWLIASTTLRAQASAASRSSALMM
jgi:hypothetical protein